MVQLSVIGMDPSLRNWGLALGTYNLVENRLEILDVRIIQPPIPTGKQVRQNSKDLECATNLYSHALAFAKGAQAVFVEVPVGSQSARAMASYGICVGVLGSLRSAGIPFFEVTPLEVKMATVGSKTASKADMIEWAISNFPDAPWPYQIRNGPRSIVEGKAEHMADAIGSVVAGMRTQPFQQLLALQRQQPAA